MATRSRSLRRVAAVCAALFVAVAACSDDPPEPFASSTSGAAATTGAAPSTVGGEPSTTAATASTAGSPTTLDVPEDVSTPSTVAAPDSVAGGTSAPTTQAAVASTLPLADTVVAFVGGTPVAASGEPLTIGWVNQEGGSPSFPEATLGFAAGVQYLNVSGGGIGGRTIAIHQCAITRAADGARCAAELAGDPSVAVVVVGAVALGNAELLDGLRGIKPVVLSTPLTTADFLATDAVAYTPGSPGIIGGLARFAVGSLPTGPPAKAAVLYPAGLAGEAAFQLLVKPVFDGAGIPAVAVPVFEGASAAAFAQALRDAGAADAGTMLPILGLRGCAALAGALVELASGAVVLATDSCLGVTMTDAVTALGGSGVLPEGWYVGSSGFRFQIPGNAELDAFLRIAGAVQSANGLPLTDLSGYAAAAFGALMDVVKVANGLGPGGWTPEAMRPALRSFGGPGWGVVGPQSCGFNVFYPSLCGTQMGVERYAGGAWQPVADGYNGAPVTLTD